MSQPWVLPPRVVVNSTFAGLLIMSFFTLFWAGNAFGGWPVPVAAVVEAGAVLVVAYLVSWAIRLFRARRSFPAELSEEEQRFRRTSGRNFGLLFGGERLAIWLVAFILGATGAGDYIVPAIAIIVGLHFYPMARLFRRRIDRYIAVWTCAVGLAGVVTLAATDFSAGSVGAAVGVGCAMATGGYGFYMARMGRGLLERLRQTTVDSESRPQMLSPDYRDPKHT